ncbi:MAG: 4-hydroxy-3-methylbut-2-enyl diphosphate reductase, partial [bacterium]
DTSEIISELKKRFPNIIEPPKEDICYATTNRQIAVKNLAKKCQLILAIGSPESSNTNRLREAAEKAGALAHLIQRAADIKEDWLENIDTVGITAGASAPEELVTEVVDWLKKHGGGEPEELVALEENVRFTLPADIIDKARETGKAQELLEKHTLSTSS